MDKCREVFEQICYQNKWNINKDGHGFYVDDFVNGAWWAYESRQAEVDQLEEWNSNQAQSIKSYQEEDEATKKLLQKLIDDEYTTMRPSMAYEIQKVLRGDDDINVTR